MAALVADTGCGVELPTIVGRPKMPGIMVGMEQKDSDVGDEVQIVEVIKEIPQEQLAERLEEQIVDAPVPQIQVQIVDVPVLQITEETDEVANVPLPHIQEQILAVVNAVPSRGENDRSPRRAQPHRRGAGGCAGRAAASVLRLRGRKLARHTPHFRISVRFLAFSSSADLPVHSRMLWGTLRLLRFCVSLCAHRR